jgi:hypothetical protein
MAQGGFAGREYTSHPSASPFYLAEELVEPVGSRSPPVKNCAYVWLN